MNSVQTDYLCIFNADGSFDPKYLNEMLSKCEENYDFIFASRYMKNSGSDDDTLITKVGNYVFTKIGNIFFSVNISDILYTYLLGKTKSFKKLNLKCKDFRLFSKIIIYSIQCSNQSWCNMIEQGATTSWEMWYVTILHLL